MAALATAENGDSQRTNAEVHPSPGNSQATATLDFSQEPELENAALHGTKNGSEDSEDDDLGDDGVESVIGVSISRQQTRLTSLKTPAAEKTAVLDQTNSWGFFNDSMDKEQAELLEHTLQNSMPTGAEQSQEARDSSPVLPGSPSDQPTAPSAPIPQREELQQLNGSGNARISSSPQRKNIIESNQSFSQTERKPFARTESVQGSAISYHNRVRSSTMNMLSDSGVGKFISNLSFPSIPESPKIFKDIAFFPNSNSTKDSKDPKGSNALSARHGRPTSLIAKLPMIGNHDTQSRPGSGEITQKLKASSPFRTVVIGTQNDGETANKKETQKTVPKTRPGLRLSASDDSLRLSRIHSLGDDTQWEHISSQVNSRMKAIKDSLQDSLPDIPNINFGALKPSLSLAYSNGTLITRPRQYSTASDRPLSPTRLVTAKYPILEATLEDLVGDIVVMGGYRGSVLRSAEPPHRQLWVPVKVGLNLRKVNLEIGLEPEDEESMEDNIFASGMLTHIGPVDMSRRLFKKLKNCKNAKDGKLRVHDYGYDWRLSPAVLSRKLIGFLEGLNCNRHGVPDSDRGAIIIAHSMGGLLTRYAVNARPELFAGVTYAGTPRHCVNILGPLRNGDEVLLSSRVLTAQVNFTLRSSFVLLPEKGQCFINAETKEPYHVDFFDVNSWKDYALSPCMAPCLPPFSAPQRKSIFGGFSGSFPNILNSNKSTESTASLEDIVATKAQDVVNPESHTLNMQMDNSSSPPSTTSFTIEEATTYLKRTLAETMAFKKALGHNASHEAANRYPPHAIMYSTSIPTVYGAKVSSREAIKHSDAFDNLAFAGGDGVVLARAAMIPKGYAVAEGGRVRTTRGHVTMLGDLEGVGKCLAAMMKARKEGVGLGRIKSQPQRKLGGVGPPQ